jgi:Tol biopolymer transport system component
MYFSSEASGDFHIWRQRFPDGLPEKITSGPTNEEGIAIEPGGRSVLTAVGPKQSSVWVHDSRGDRQISLEGEATLPKLSPDGKKLLYKIRSKGSDELWLADLESNHAEPFLPGFPIAVSDQGSFWTHGYDISPDGRKVVFYAPDGDNKTRLWLAPLDRSSPPRQIPNLEGEQPVFGQQNQIFFRKVEGTSAFLYTVREDGNGLRKIADQAVVNVFGMDAQRKWILVGQNGGEVLLPIAGGAPVLTHLHPPDNWLRWSGDGKYVFLCSTNSIRSKSYVLPLSPGQVFPEIFASVRDDPGSEAELMKLPGLRILPAGDVEPGPTADTYAYTRQSVQRNLYRIPLP